MSKQTEILDSVRRFAQQCHYEKEHSEQVMLLAGRLFDLLEPVHGVGADQKWMLTAGSLLHDIGWMHGQSKHHKIAMDMILSDTTIPLEPQDRKLIALTARYHRRALPKDSHPVYGQLSARQRRIVNVLGGILRLADGLDRGHTSAVQDLDIEIGSDLINIICFGSQSVSEEIQWGQKKADLLELSLSVKIHVVCGEEGCT
jgi:exopolyphosphatase/guanosine-5'-triphosphate,3'-diphosphate pyrophosphatase